MVKWHSKINLQKHEWMSCKKSYYQGYLWWWDFSAGKLWYGIMYGAIGRRYLGKILRSRNAWWVIRVKRPVAAMFLNASCVLTLKQVPANKRSSSLHLELVWRVSKTNSLAETEFFFSWVVLVANSELPWCFMSWQLVSLSVIIFTLEQARKRRLNISLK